MWFIVRIMNGLKENRFIWEFECVWFTFCCLLYIWKSMKTLIGCKEATCVISYMYIYIISYNKEQFLLCVYL
jgi:hypothetical protein